MCFFVLAWLVNEKWEHVVKTTSFTKLTYRSVWSVHLLDVSSQRCGGHRQILTCIFKQKKTALLSIFQLWVSVYVLGITSKQKYICSKLTRLPDSGSKWPLRYQTVHKSSVRNVTDCFTNRIFYLQCLLNKQLKGLWKISCFSIMNVIYLHFGFSFLMCLVLERDLCLFHSPVMFPCPSIIFRIKVPNF